MKKVIYASELINDIKMELESILASEGNGAEVVGMQTHDTYWLWVQETGPGYAIYFNDTNVWRDKSKDTDPVYFSSLEDVAKWLINN